MKKHVVENQNRSKTHASVLIYHYGTKYKQGAIIIKKIKVAHSAHRTLLTTLIREVKQTC